MSVPNQSSCPLQANPPAYHSLPRPNLPFPWDHDISEIWEVVNEWMDALSFLVMILALCPFLHSATAQEMATVKKFSEVPKEIFLKEN